MWNPPQKLKPLDIEEKIRRGTNAEMLLKNETLKEAFEDIERGLLTKWRTTSVEEVQRREYAWLVLNALDDVSKRLQTWVNEGKLEADKVKAAQVQKKRTGRYYE